MKRRGFTLIELMVVIAIIIILAAVAIPNYLNMTERAKKSRVASDMATVATALETFRTDWSVYPGTGATKGSALGTNYVAVNDKAKPFYMEMGGSSAGGTASAAINVAGSTNAMGEAGGIEYLKAATLDSIVDPFKKGTTAPSDGKVYYASNGTSWLLFAWSRTSGANDLYFQRTDAASTVTEAVLPTNY